METKTQEKGSGKDIDFNPEGFHIICGTGPKNGINGTIPGIKGCGEGRALDLTGLYNLLVCDLEYFVEHKEEILGMAKGQIDRRDHFREHPEELEEKMNEARKET